MKKYAIVIVSCLALSACANKTQTGALVGGGLGAGTGLLLGGTDGAIAGGLLGGGVGALFGMSQDNNNNDDDGGYRHYKRGHKH